MAATDQITRLINETSESATGAVSRSLKELQTSHIAATETTTETITRRLKELQDSAQASVEQTKQTASSAVSEILETQNMLRSDTTALFERLREANILLQEVLSGAHENMSGIEATLVTRVSDFVAAMNDVAQKTGTANGEMERNIAGFNALTTETLRDLSQLAHQFDAHGRSLAEAVALIDTSNRRTETTLADRRMSLEELMTALDGRSNDLEQRLMRFANVLDQSLEGAAERAREISRVTADSATSGVRAISD